MPSTTWDCRLGDCCVLEWILDQYKEKRPRDRTIREKFDNCRFAECNEKVVDLSMRVATVSVETRNIVEATRSAMWT